MTDKPKIIDEGWGPIIGVKYRCNKCNNITHGQAPYSNFHGCDTCDSWTQDVTAIRQHMSTTETA